MSYMWLLVHFHRYDYVYFDNHRITKHDKYYGVWRKRGNEWELVATESNKIRAFVITSNRALVMESDTSRVLQLHIDIEPAREIHVSGNQALDPLDELLLRALQDEGAVLDMLRDVLDKGG